MKYLISILALLLIGFFVVKTFQKKMKKTTVVDAKDRVDSLSIHNLNIKPLMSEEYISLDKYKGKVILAVNVASKCGLTPQYEDLQALHEELGEKGLAILGFPSNNFMNQEPGTEEEIASFCQKNYGVDFDMFEKVNVKGDDKHPVYQFLTEKEKNGVLESQVSWNFQKYLLDKEGKLVAVFNPKVSVTEPEIRNQIIDLLDS